MKKVKLLFMTLALGFLSISALSLGNGKGAKFDDAESVYDYKDFIRKANADTVINEGWNQKIFGHFQNSNERNYSVNVVDNKVTMDVLTSSEDTENSAFPKLTSQTDSLGYFFKEISDPSATFTLSATMDIEEVHGVKVSSAASANYGVGLMVRDDICPDATEANNYYVKSYRSSYAAVGNFGFPVETSTGDIKTNNIWYRDGGTAKVTNKKSNTVILPSETNQTVLGAKLLLQKTENSYYLKYECTQGENTVTLSHTYTPTPETSFTGPKLYAGLFVAGPIKVSFSDIHYECSAVEDGGGSEVEPSEPQVIDTKWGESIFGNFYGSDMTPNYSIEATGSNVVMQDGVDETKNTAKINSTSEGLLFRYQAIDASKDFKFKAKMQINEINILSRAVKDRACGIQVRDDVLENLTRNTTYNKDYLAIGNYGLPFGTDDKTDGKPYTKNAFGRVNGVLTKFKANSGSENNKVYVPRVEDGVLLDNVVVDLEIVKQNNNYTLSYVVGDMVVSYTQAMDLGIESKKVYVGLFVTGAMKVTFSDVYLEYAGYNSYLGHQESMNSDAVRFLGNLFVGPSATDLEKLNENYSRIQITIYVILNGQKKYAELTTKGIMKQVQNGEEYLNADEGWYFFAIKIENIPEDVSLEIKKVETALIPVQKGV